MWAGGHREREGERRGFSLEGWSGGVWWGSGGWVVGILWMRAKWPTQVNMGELGMKVNAGEIKGGGVDALGKGGGMREVTMQLCDC